MKRLVMYRLIADDGKILKRGDRVAKIVDVAPNGDPNEWIEIEETSLTESNQETSEINNKNKIEQI